MCYIKLRNEPYVESKADLLFLNNLSPFDFLTGKGETPFSLSIKIFCLETLSLSKLQVDWYVAILMKVKVKFWDLGNLTIHLQLNSFLQNIGNV